MRPSNTIQVPHLRFQVRGELLQDYSMTLQRNTVHGIFSMRRSCGGVAPRGLAVQLPVVLLVDQQLQGLLRVPVVPARNGSEALPTRQLADSLQYCYYCTLYTHAVLMWHRGAQRSADAVGAFRLSTVPGNAYCFVVPSSLRPNCLLATRTSAASLFPPVREAGMQRYPAQNMRTLHPNSARQNIPLSIHSSVDSTGKP